MNQRTKDQLRSIIGRLEDWQNNNHQSLVKAGVQHSDINKAKSELLMVLSRIGG